MIIVKVDFDRDCFKSVIEKMNGYYKDYYINELPVAPTVSKNYVY